jgi:peptide/nickel transport system substrate-binding protein
MQIRNLRLLSVTVAAVMLFMAGCSTNQTSTKPQDSDPQTQQPGASTGPKKGGTLTIGRPTDSISLDMHAESTSPGNWIMSNIYETLIKMTPDTEFEPLLAESWTQPDPDRWVFNLRKGVQFHDGTEFTADAVKFSIERITNADNPGRARSNLLFIKEINVLDDHTLEIVTNGPYGATLNALSITYMGGVVSPTAVAKFGDDFGRNPVGTGPFKFVEWRSNNQTVIERNDAYWGEKPLLDKVVYRVIPEESARMFALQTGEIDVVMNPAPTDIDSLKNDKNFVVHEVPGVRVFYFGFNQAKAPLDDVRVRQAIVAGTDRKSIVDNILEGSATLPGSYISPSIFGFKDMSSHLAYDSAKAERLLDESGWIKGADGIRVKDGKPLSIELWTPKGRYPKDSEASEAFQGQMKKLGVDIKVQVMEWGTLFTQLRSGPTTEAQMFVLAWATVTGDADYTIPPLFHSTSLPPGGWNSYGYRSSAFDALAEEVKGTVDQNGRQELFHKMQDVLFNDAVINPIYNSKEIIVTGAHVKGFAIHPIDYFLWWNTTWLDK